MRKWLSDLKAKQKKEYRNLLEEDRVDGNEEAKEGEEDEDGSSSGDDEPSAKRMRKSRMSVDARIAQAANDLGDLPVYGLGTSRMTRSFSRLSRSSRASSVASSVISTS